jgi:hypothetical protein
LWEEKKTFKTWHSLLMSGSFGVSGVLAVKRCFDVLRDRVWGVILCGLGVAAADVGIFEDVFNGEFGETGPFFS